MHVKFGRGRKSTKCWSSVCRSREPGRVPSQFRRVKLGMWWRRRARSQQGLHHLHLTISPRSNKLDDVPPSRIFPAWSTVISNFSLATIGPINLDDSEHENANRSWKERPCPAVTRRLGTAHGSTRPWGGTLLEH